MKPTYAVENRWVLIWGMCITLNNNISNVTLCNVDNIVVMFDKNATII